MTKKTLPIDDRIQRFALVTDKLRDTLMPDKNKAVTFWVRIKTGDFGLSVLNVTAIGKTLHECCEKAEEGILDNFNDYYGLETPTFEEMLDIVETIDLEAVKEELMTREKQLTKELNEVCAALTRLKNREALMNRRNKKNNAEQAETI
jgi:hypothetical protein